MRYDNPALRTALTDAYVLGTLHGGARRRFEQLLRHDPDLQHMVTESSNHWDLLVTALPVVEPSPQTWRAIEYQVEHDLAIQQASADTDSSPSDSGTFSLSDVARKLRFWRSWAVSSSIAALATMVLTGYLLFFPAQEIRYVVLMADDANARTAWMLTTSNEEDQLNIRTLRPQEIPQDRVFQLWIKLASESQVLPVGLIPPSGEQTLTLPASIKARLDEAQLFGVSIEPPGGSPTGQPTTTPLYHGTPIEI